jgi:hypothetical protein
VCAKSPIVTRFKHGLLVPKPKRRSPGTGELPYTPMPTGRGSTEIEVSL